ncbi:hypothetical protein C2845_PM01G28320 [Panicum miliaceum]|uniref:Uncharacterized protein n=1 Tax=Panicum miliaceum TaxID=4540 RepID=A0A3L6TRI7_PANMI|nr:hypothetical protein C2845_PM01G28320 [Panicum miliaceum]
MAAHVSGGWEMVCTGDQRLPSAIFRFEAHRGLPMYFAAAYDSKILAVQPLAAGTTLPCVFVEHLVNVFDVRTRSCLVAPRPEASGADPIYIPAGGRLFALAAGTFDWLDPPPPPRGTPAYGGKAREWSWFEIPDPPFKRRLVTSYAVHADGQTIFFSIKKGASAATFSFETEEHGGVWHRHGKWALPFTAARTLTPTLTPGLGFPGSRTASATSSPATWCPPTSTPTARTTKPIAWACRAFVWGRAQPGSYARRSCSAMTRPRGTLVPPSCTWDAEASFASCSASRSTATVLTRGVTATWMAKTTRPMRGMAAIWRNTTATAMVTYWMPVTWRRTTALTANRTSKT